MFDMDKTVKKNILALLIYQGSALLIPLITLPYLARVLGVDAFGRLGWCLAIIQYFILLVDYGFNLSITAKIAKVQDNKAELTKIFFTTFYAKAVLMLAGLLILGCGWFVPIVHNNLGLILCCYLTVMGSFLFPMWFLQGIEKMDIIANSTLLTRVLSIPLIFLYVHSSEDVCEVAVIQGGLSIVASMIALGKIYRLKLLQSFYQPNLTEIKRYLVEGWHYFISIGSVSLYTNTNILILGLVTNSTVVGYFTGVDKIKGAMLSVLSPFLQAIYPKINKLMMADEDQAFKFIAKYLLAFGFGALGYSVLIFLFSPFIIKILLGENYLQAVRDLQVLAFLPFLIVLNNFFGTQIMLPLGKKTVFMNIILLCGLINVLILIPLSMFYLDFGACVAIMITEVLVTVVMGWYVHQYKPDFFRLCMRTLIKRQNC